MVLWHLSMYVNKILTRQSKYKYCKSELKWIPLLYKHFIYVYFFVTFFFFWIAKNKLNKKKVLQEYFNSYTMRKNGN